MKYKVHCRYLFIIILCSLLMSCQSSMTPLQVAEKFWRGLIHNDIKKINKYSLKGSLSEQTLPEKIKNVSFGKIIIDGNQAEIETTLHIDAESKSTDIMVITFLQLEDKAWRVNYKKQFPHYSSNKK